MNVGFVDQDLIYGYRANGRSRIFSFLYQKNRLGEFSYNFVQFLFNPS